MNLFNVYPLYEITPSHGSMCYVYDKEDKKYLDLSKEIVNFCIDNNLEFENSSQCTIDNNSFNSYRRDKTNLRQRSMIWI